MAAFIVKADIILDESNLNCIYRLNKNLKFCIELKEYLLSFLLGQLREEKIEQVFIFHILLKYNLWKKKTQEFCHFNIPSYTDLKWFSQKTSMFVPFACIISQHKWDTTFKVQLMQCYYSDSQKKSIKQPSTKKSNSASFINTL